MVISASKRKCKGACDKSVNHREADSYEDDARDEIEEDLKLRIKVLVNETRSLLRTKDKLKKALTECLDRDPLSYKTSDMLVSKILFRKLICATCLILKFWIAYRYIESFFHLRFLYLYRVSRMACANRFDRIYSGNRFRTTILVKNCLYKFALKFIVFPSIWLYVFQ